MEIKLKKIISVITLTCFLVSSVFGELLNATLAMKVEPRKHEQILEDFVIPPGYGRCTDSKLFDSKQIVINIQDLHCHPEVQRNISNILESLNKKYGLKNIYVEGGYGSIDTSWICNIKDKKVKKEIIENLIDQGRLTGTEYYSVISNKPNLLKGIEDEAIHKANIVRLGKILNKKEHFEKKIQELNKTLEFMKAKYISSRNRSFNNLIEKYKSSDISTEKYYEFLGKCIETINKKPEKFNNILSITIDNYPNIKTYFEAMHQEKKLKYKRISRQLQKFIEV
ncbi:MAG: hypothetical protein ABII90_02175 [Bacteroidota bacterium]